MLAKAMCVFAVVVIIAAFAGGVAQGILAILGIWFLAAMAYAVFD